MAITVTDTETGKSHQFPMTDDALAYVEAVAAARTDAVVYDHEAGTLTDYDVNSSHETQVWMVTSRTALHYLADVAGLEISLGF